MIPLQTVPGWCAAHESVLENGLRNDSVVQREWALNTGPNALPSPLSQSLQGASPSLLTTTEGQTKNRTEQSDENRSQQNRKSGDTRATTTYLVGKNKHSADCGRVGVCVVARVCACTCVCMCTCVCVCVCVPQAQTRSQMNVCVCEDVSLGA